MKNRPVAWLVSAAMVFASSLHFPASASSDILPGNDRTKDLFIPAGQFASIMAGDTAEPVNDNIYTEIPVTSFRVSEISPGTDTDLDYTDWWFSEWDDCRYIFLPATADRNDLVITYTAEDTLCLNGEEVPSGEHTAILSGSDEFDITVGDKACGKLKIMQSNLGCIYLSTSTGGLDFLDGSRYRTETGTALMLNAEGGTEFSGEIAKLSPHGNSSWDYSKKKSYNLKLPKKQDLYGMGKAKKWTLISNYLDHSMIRNMVTDEIARAAGMDCVLDSVFVDLYADGSYRGTYQLYERVQIQKNRVNIRDLEEETEKLNGGDLEAFPRNHKGSEKLDDYMENSCKYYDIPNDPEDITGGYLLQFQQFNRYPYKCTSGFVTSRGQAIEVDGPEYISEAQAEYIRSFVQDLEDAIYSDTGFNSKGKHYSEYCDVDSLITAYLIEEISENIDSTSSSFYLWKDSDLTGDGKIHFSPAWDHDFSYGCFPAKVQNEDGETGFSYRTDNLYAVCFPIQGYQESGRPTAGRSWIGTLYQNESFVRRTAQIYSVRFAPFLRRLSAPGSPYIKELAGRISSSADMSNARWHTYGGAQYCVFGSSSGKDFMGSVDLVRSFIENRESWLTGLWKPYLTLSGDVNADGSFNAADLVLLQKWLLGAAGTELADWKSADLVPDGIIDTFDLCIMRNRLVS